MDPFIINAGERAAFRLPLLHPWKRLIGPAHGALGLRRTGSRRVKGCIWVSRRRLTALHWAAGDTRAARCRPFGEPAALPRSGVGEERSGDTARPCNGVRGEDARPAGAAVCSWSVPSEGPPMAAPSDPADWCPAQWHPPAAPLTD